MSAIDQYKHRHIGFIECPSTFGFGDHNLSGKIAIYELLENIPDDEEDFDGKIGDVILGGGKGEAQSFRISIPQAMKFFTMDESDQFDTYSDLFKAFWTPTQSYIYCDGFSKLGWSPNIPVEIWFAENICLTLIDNVEVYSEYRNNSLAKSSLQFSHEF